MPHYLDLFPQNYGVSANPLDTLNVDPLKFLGNSPFGDPLKMAEEVLGGFITMANLVIQAVIPGIPQLPSLTTLLTDLSTFLGPLNFLSGVPIVGQLFGTGGSNTGLFGSSSLFSAGGLFGGLLSNIPFLSQLIGAGGGNPNAPNLISEFVSIFTGSGGLGFGSLISLFTNAIPGLSGASGLGSIFTDILGLLGSPTGLGSGTPGVPGVSSIPILGGLFGSSGLLGGFTSGIPILSQLINLIPGIGGGLTGLGGLGSIFTDLFGLLGNPTAVGSGSPALPGISSIPLLGGLFGSTGLLGGFTSGIPILSQLINLIPGIGGGLTGLGGLGSIFTDLFGLLGNPGGVGSGSPILGSLGSIPLLGPLQSLIDGVSGGSSNPISTLINDLLYGIGSIDPARITHVPLSAIGNGLGSTTGATPNLILNPTFDGATSVVANDPNWVYDGTVDHTGTTGSGSVKTTANGTPLTLLSNPMAVSVGQAFSFSGWTLWSGLTSTGSPITLGLQTYDSVGNPVSSPTIQAVTSPGSSGGWTQLSGSWTAPAGVTTVRVALNVGSSATAGHVWFDDLSATKTGLMQGSWMSGINGTVAQDLQAIPDMFLNFFTGGSSSGNPLGSITSSLQGLFGGLIPGAASNGDGTASIANIFTPITDLLQGIASFGGVLGTNPSSGSLFDMGNGTALSPTALLQNLGGLVGMVTGLQGQLQSMADMIVNAATGGSTTGNPLDSVLPSLQSIPFSNIQGIQGILDIGTSLQHTLDNLATGFTLGGGGISGAGLPQVANLAQNILGMATTSQTLGVNNQNTLLVRNNQPVHTGLDATAEAPFPLNLGTTMTATSTSSPMSFLRVGQMANKGSVSTVAQVSGTITNLVFNVYKMDGSQNLQKVYTTPDMHLSLNGANWAWLQNILGGSSNFAVNPGDVLAFEPIVTGSGTLTLPSQTMTNLPNHPNAVPKHYAASRNPATLGASPSSIAAASVSYGGNQPWWNVGITNVPANYQPPQLNEFNSPGAYTYTLPSWLTDGDIITVAVLGAGGGGQSGGYGASGSGGGAGQWMTASLVYNSDPNGTGYPIIPGTTTTFSGTVGAGGSGGGNPWLLQPGQAGSASTVTGTGITTLTAAAGLGGGNGYTGSGTGGQGAGSQTVNGYTFVGGGAVGTNSSASNPGGGGGSGYPAVGRPGATGAVWFRAYRP